MMTLTFSFQDQIWKNANTQDFMESFEDCGRLLSESVHEDLRVEEVKVIV